MESSEHQVSRAAPTETLNPNRSARQGFVTTVLVTLTFGGSGTWLCLQGDSSGFLFLGLTLVLTGLALVGVTHRRRVSRAGLPEPSAAWRLAGHAAQGVRVFAYSRGSIWIVRACGALTSLTGPAIYLLSRPRPAGTELWWLAAFAMMFSGMFFLMVLACERYRVEVSPDEIVHYRLRSPLRYAFQSLGSVALLESGGRGANYVLALYDKQGHCVDTFANTLEGFTELVALMKEHAFAAGVAYRYRDKWGVWTR